MPTRSPGFSMAGPDVARTDAPISLAMHVRERRLAQAGRAVQQHVIERFAALARRRHRHAQILADPLLADVLVEHARAQPRFVLRLFLPARRPRHQPFIGHHVLASSLSALLQRAARSCPRCGGFDGALDGLFGERSMIAQVR